MLLVSIVENSVYSNNVLSSLSTLHILFYLAISFFLELWHHQSLLIFYIHLTIAEAEYIVTVFRCPPLEAGMRLK